MKLDVWLEAFEAPVGHLERRDDKSLEFRYARDAEPQHRISMAMPVREEPYSDAAARAFFGNLLFEGRELERVMAAHGLDRDDIGALLGHLGADCPGAISVTPDGTGPGKRPGIFPDDYDLLTPERLIEIVTSLHFHGSLPEDTKDPSPVAGVQPKLALVRHDGSYHLPKPGSRAPTTHILKISPRKSFEITRHEAALLSLAHEVGLSVADHEAIEFYDEETGAHINAILSTRFDREVDAGRITRIHTEDFCQALGLPRQLKYERDAKEEGRRFSMAAVSTLADQTRTPGMFRLRVLEQALFNLAVGNTDNHAKNSSILYRGASGELAPLYDVVPVIMDERVTHQLSFRIGEAMWSEDVDRAAIDAMMLALGFKKPEILRPTKKMLEQIFIKAMGFLEQRGGKALADAVAAQMGATPLWKDLDLPVPEGDYFPRLVRDEKPELHPGGWPGLS